MTIPATIATGGHVTDPEIVDAQLAILQLLLAFTNGVLNAANGGTAGTATPTNGGSAYGTGTALAYTAAGTSGQLLQSAGAAAPVWAGETAWTAVSGGVGFQNSWVDNAGGFQAASFFKDASGFVYVRGFIKNGTIGLAAFTLPAGYRPANARRFPAESNAAHGSIQLDSAGVVTPLSGSNVNFTVEFSFDTR